MHKIEAILPAVAVAACMAFHNASDKLDPPMQSLGNQCCGMLFNSRGFKEAAAVKAGELEVCHLPAPLLTVQGSVCCKMSVHTSNCRHELMAELQSASCRMRA